jgi:tetratricopeptide (TPR) repeat protein
MQSFDDPYFCAIKLPRCHALTSFTLFLLLMYSTSANAQPEEKEIDKDQPKLSAVYAQYAKEATSGKRTDSETFRSFWEKQFTDILAATKGGGMVRYRMLDELGAIQRNLGKTQDAIDTYRRLEEYARMTNNLEAMTTAAENELGLVRQKPLEIVRPVAEKLQTYLEQLTNKESSPTNLDRLSNDLIGIGSTLYHHSADAKDENQRKQVLERALDVFNKSVALGKSGGTPIAVRMYLTAQTLSKLGQKKEAAAMYGKVADMDQTDLSKLWLAYLQIEETTTKDSDAYRQAIERALQKHEKEGGVDEYEITMRHQLGISYRNAKQLEKSTAILSSLVGKSNDDNFNAYNLLLVAYNTLDAGQKEAARDIFAEIVRRYPGTGSAQAAEREIKEGTQGAKGIGSRATSTKKEQWRTAVILVLMAQLVLVAAWYWYKRRGQRAIVRS